MSVTLEVLKLSSWLNADAPCRESKEGHVVRGEVYGSGDRRRWTTVEHAACRGGRGCRLGHRAGGGAYGEHVAHVCDAGGIPAGNICVEIIHIVVIGIVRIVTVRISIRFREEVAHVGDL